LSQQLLSTRKQLQQVSSEYTAVRQDMLSQRQAATNLTLQNQALQQNTASAQNELARFAGAAQQSADDQSDLQTQLEEQKRQSSALEVLLQQERSKGAGAGQ
jgi:hypothetical protein